AVASIPASRIGPRSDRNPTSSFATRTPAPDILAHRGSAALARVRLNGTVDLPAVALLGVVTGVLVWRAVSRERRDYAKFKRLRSTVARQKVYRRWVREAFLSLGGLSVATIVGGWDWIAPLLADAQDWPPIAASRSVLGGEFGLAIGIGV